METCQDGRSRILALDRLPRKLSACVIVIQLLTICLAEGFRGEPLGQPKKRKSINGILETRLAIQYADNMIDGQSVRLRSYEGGLFGPTLEVEPGDRITITLTNQLGNNSNKCSDDGKVPCDPFHRCKNPRSINCPHGFNVTNFHYHGLHVSPAGNGDNVLIEIRPGTQFITEVRLPDDHPAGTFWYHPHKHGSTALQLASGMSGALIVKGEIDKVPAIKEAKDLILNFQQIPYLKEQHQGLDAGTVESFAQLRSPPRGFENKVNEVTLINGQMHPVIRMRPGEVQRWRLIDSGILELLKVRLTGHRLHLFAHDGLTTGRLEGLDAIELAPGYRADVLVCAGEVDGDKCQPGQPGEYRLVDLKSSAKESLHGVEEQERLLAKVVIVGPTSRPMRLPSSDELEPLAYHRSIGKVTRKRCVNFAQEKVDLPQDSFFNINGYSYNPAAVPWQLELDTAEEWVLTSEKQHHPFHIHVNPFLVVKRNGVDEGLPVWRDTVLVRMDETITVRTRFTRWIGKSVFHCHILNHEDQGMMQQVELVPSSHPQPTGDGVDEDCPKKTCKSENARLKWLIGTAVAIFVGICVAVCQLLWRKRVKKQLLGTRRGRMDR